MKNFCIGISGKKQSGKDTVYNILKPLIDNEMNRNFQRCAFADAVKNILCLSYYDQDLSPKKITRQFIEDHKNDDSYIPEGWNVCIRNALHIIGNNFREICPTIWIDLALLNNKKDIIMTDVRYENEIKAIKRYCFPYVIRIIRKNIDNTSKLDSEINLDSFDKLIGSNFEGVVRTKNVPYDYVLRNNGDLNELKDKIKQDLVPNILKNFKYFFNI